MLVEKPGICLDTTKLINPSINYLPYVFSSLRNMKGGETFELVSKRPFKLSEPMKENYEAETSFSCGKYSTRILKV
jgi:uncharacterized protein YqjF (DUF2071 family)